MTTLLGGQSFSWDFDFNTQIFTGITQDKVIKLKPGDKNGKYNKNGVNEYIYWQTYPDKDNFEYIKTYLQLDKNYNQIIKNIKGDRHIESAMKVNPNLRVLKQDFELTLLYFILSQHKNIKAIKKTVQSLSKYGNTIKVSDGSIKQEYKVNLFPNSEVINELTEEQLKETGMGFRTKYFKDAARKLIEDHVFENINELSEEEARERLMNIHGVGPKIADCVLAFSLGFDNVTPIDIWGQRVVNELYGEKEIKKYEHHREWFKNRFNGYAAWAGQFLFEYIRKLNRVSKDT